MPKFYTSVILLITHSKEIGKKQFSVFSSGGGKIGPLMHVTLSSVAHKSPGVGARGFASFQQIPVQEAIKIK